MPAIVIDANNFFNSGWLAAFIGMPRESVQDWALRECDVAAWLDGYDMKKETKNDAACLAAFRGMMDAGQITAEWEDE